MDAYESNVQAIRRSLEYLREVLALPDPVDAQLQKLCAEPATPVIDIVQAGWPGVIHETVKIETIAVTGTRVLVGGQPADRSFSTTDRPLIQTRGPGWQAVVQELFIDASATAGNLGITISLNDQPIPSLLANFVFLRSYEVANATARVWASQGAINDIGVFANLQAEPALGFRPMTVVPHGYSLAFVPTGNFTLNEFGIYVQHIPPGLSLPY